MKKLLMTLLGVLLALPGIAQDFTYEYEGQKLTYTVIDETAKTCKTKGDWDSGNNVSGNLIIPSVAKYNNIIMGNIPSLRSGILPSVTTKA